MKKQTICTLLLCAALFLTVGIVPTLSGPTLSDTVPLNPPYVFLQSWGDEIGVFHRPEGIAVSGERIYISDTENNRIQIFDVHGKPLAIFGGMGSGDGQFNSPSGIAVDGSGNVYVVDRFNYRIQKFTSDGIFLTKWGSEGSRDGQFYIPDGIAVDGDGNVYVTERFNNRIQKFTSAGTFLTKWGSQGSGDGQFRMPFDVAVDGNGNVYVIESVNSRIQKFTSDGTFLTKWGGQGSGDGQFDSPSGIAVDGSGNVYVADRYNHRIQKFTSDGTFLTKWGSGGSEDGQFDRPHDIAVDKSGNVYVVDSGNERIQKFTSDGAFLTKWASGSSIGSVLDIIRAIAVDGNGNVYVVDTVNHQVQKFSSDGTFLAQWGNEGSGNGQFKYLQGIAVDENDNVYVTDTGNKRIQKFTSDGTFLTVWGSEGSGDGQFSGPRGVEVDGDGNVYVADTRNNRIQKFAPDYPTPDPAHGLAFNGSFEETPNLAHWTYGGELPVALVNDASTRVVRMGEPVTATAQGQGMVWLRQTMYIHPEWARPLLTFRYRMFVNDISHHSDFYVRLTTSNNAWLADIKHDGFDSPDNTPPSPGHDMGWRTASYDLSAFKGQTVRLVFENRNLWSTSWGIWTDLDDVRVVDDDGPPFWPVPDSSSWTIYPGTTITNSITITASATFTQPVALALGGLPDGVEGTFSPNPALPNTTVDVELVASPSTALGTYGLVITASADVPSGTATATIFRTTHVSLAVMASVYVPLVMKH